MTMPSLIRVEPVGPVWALSTCLSENPIYFSTGARAEVAARRLAERLADAGEPVVLEIRLRDGQRAGRFLFPPRFQAEVLEASSAA